MSELTLAQAVERFAGVGQRLADADLDRDWAWHAYDSEGVRFAFFRTYEELRELAVITASERAAHAPITPAQRILAEYHAAYRDLQAVLIGSDDAVDRVPAEGEWSLRDVLKHIIDADASFFVVLAYALERHRSGDGRPAKVPEAVWEAILGDTEAHFDATMQGPIAGVWAYYADHHERVLRDFAGIGEAELELPSLFWEGYEMSLRFRLHRFDSHLRQHTIQAEKTLAAIGRGPSEARRLLRLIYAALAEAESTVLGGWQGSAERWRTTAAAINARADEIAA